MCASRLPPGVPRTNALYARGSTADQDPERQLDELREFAAGAYPSQETTEYVDIVSGTPTEREAYDQLWDDISAGKVAVVIVDEISRLSRLGSGEIHRFVQYCLEHGTSIEDREVGLSLDVDDSEITQPIMETLIGLMGSLAKVEHKQKLRRNRSGIAAAQEAGKWTGRPPRGFTVDDGYLRVDVEEFLRARASVERVVAGEPTTTVADDVGLPTSTLSRLAQERTDLYLHGETTNERIDAALADVRTLPDPAADSDAWRDGVRAIVREEPQKRRET